MAGVFTMTPSSISFTGTDATILSDGVVSVDACSTISLNGVFTSAYDNYTVIYNISRSSGSTEYMKLRAAGTDTTGSDYIRQYMYYSTTSFVAGRSGTYAEGLEMPNPYPNSNVVWINVYGPALAQDTVARTATATDQSSALGWISNSLHLVSSAYDGFTRPTSGATTITGTIHVLGYEE